MPHVHHTYSLPVRDEFRPPELHKKAASYEDIEYVFMDEPVHPGLSLVYVIDSLYVPPESRRQGIGSKLMQAECRRADRAGYWLILHCYPWESMEENPWLTDWDSRVEQLQSFYARFGFLDVGGGWMYRKPKKR